MTYKHHFFSGKAIN